MLEPMKTYDFQAVKVPTKIFRGCVQVLSTTTICQPNEKVTQAMVKVCDMMKLKAITLSLKLVKIYTSGVVSEAGYLENLNDFGISFSLPFRFRFSFSFLPFCSFSFLFFPLNPFLYRCVDEGSGCCKECSGIV